MSLLQDEVARLFALAAAATVSLGAFFVVVANQGPLHGVLAAVVLAPALAGSIAAVRFAMGSPYEYTSATYALAVAAAGFGAACVLSTAAGVVSYMAAPLGLLGLVTALFVRFE